jgi:hypothetical protein
MTTCALSAFVLLLASACSAAQTAPPAFDGIDKWKSTLTPTAITSLKSLYSTDPPAKFMGKNQEPTPDIAPETDFWQSLISSGMTDFDVRTIGEQDQQGLHIVSLAVSMKTKTAVGPRSRYVLEQQAWAFAG